MITKHLGRDHPRGCGGAMNSPPLFISVWGSSPRVRGSRKASQAPCSKAGIIPAGAGEPRKRTRRDDPTWDHPRGCGGADSPTRRSFSVLGSSPRVRGSHGAAWEARQDVGIIPAGAGEPNPILERHIAIRDHPRGCGGAMKKAQSIWMQQGSSPRVRGSRSDVSAHHAFRGIIPAGAGEPTIQNRAPLLPADHPRGCGGAVSVVGDP